MADYNKTNNSVATQDGSASEVTGSRTSNSKTRGNKSNKSSNSKRKTSRATGGSKADSKRKGNSGSSLFGSSQYIMDVTRLPFTNTAGINVNISGDVYSAGSKADLNSMHFTTPGIAAITMHPGTTSNGFMSALNIAARNLYTVVTANNSRNSTYDASDLMIYIMATSELFKLWRFATTVYGVATQYSALNRYLPDSLLHAMGMNPDSIRDNICGFRARLNQLSSKINSIVIPTGIKFTQFQFERYAAIYADSENSRAQLYLFKPSGYMLFDDAYSEQGAGLRYKAFTSNSMAWTDLLNILDTMATAIISGSVNNLISADILKAFGNEVISIPEIPEDYVTPIVYDMEMLENINNMRLDGAEDLKTDLYQVIPSGANTAPYLESKATLTPANDTARWVQHSLATFINTNYEDLSADQVFYRIMYQMPMVSYTGTTIDVALLDGYVSKLELFLDPSATTASQSMRTSVRAQTTSPVDLGNISQFDNHPLLFIADTSLPEEGKFKTFFGDVKNMCFIKSSDASNIMQAALLALFSV